MFAKQDYQSVKTYGAQQLARMILNRVGAALGTAYVGTGTFTIDTYAFEASEDSTITSVKTLDKNDEEVEMIDLLDLTENSTLVIKAHQLVSWGFVATKVTVVTGSGLLIRASQLNIPDAV